MTPSPDERMRVDKFSYLLRLALLVSLALAVPVQGGDHSNSTSVQPDPACQESVAGAAVRVGSGIAGDPALPEPASGYKLGKAPVIGSQFMISTANPLATAAGCAVLQRGGSAVDAVIAAQAVLGLVEPQSSGLGGGGFMLTYDAHAKSVSAYDGRETAPAAATENYLRYVGDTAASGAPVPSVRASGRSIGTPGIMRMLELAHREQGVLAWPHLFGEAQRLATDGFRIGGRLADAIVANREGLLRDADAQQYFFNPDFTPKALGSLLRNPAYAQTLAAIGSQGANAMHTGPIAQAIVDKIRVSRSVPATTTGSASVAVPITPGLTTLADLANYQPKKREALCSRYRAYVVCGMPPPSSGGIAIAQILGMLETFDMAAHRPAGGHEHGGKPSVQAVHLISEAQRLAFADRNAYVADTDFVPLPGSGVASMLDSSYLRQRAALISPTRSLGTAVPGTFTVPSAMGAHAQDGNGTSHISAVDAKGNVAVLTTSIEGSMGSFRMTHGFLLNNQLTDFSAAPSDANGPIANRVQPNKRPRSSMAPTLVFRAQADGSRGDFVMATGSPGGAAIIFYVTKTLVAALDWGLDAQQATSLVNFGSANGATTFIGGEHPAINTTNHGDHEPLVTGLRALGHTVNLNAQPSGVATVMRTLINGKPLLIGAADPRREGIALGDGVTP